MPGGSTDREKLVAVARAHAEAEGRGDMDGTMGTLGADPVYELLPIGLVLRGRDAARTYYEHFFADFAPRIRGYSLRSEWITDEGLGQEYQMTVKGSEGLRRFDIIGMLNFGTDGLLSGERLYASDELFTIMSVVGPSRTSSACAAIESMVRSRSTKPSFTVRRTLATCPAPTVKHSPLAGHCSCASQPTTGATFRGESHSPSASLHG
jgi:hypothetical protein